MLVVGKVRFGDGLAGENCIDLSKKRLWQRLDIEDITSIRLLSTLWGENDGTDITAFYRGPCEE